MKARYLEVTFRKGKPLAAYLYLPRQPGVTSARTEKADHGIIVDFAESGEVIGLEITAPALVTVGDVNQVLQRYGLEQLAEEEFAPLAA
jgi:uncharacterized protein YuzE